MRGKEVQKNAKKSFSWAINKKMLGIIYLIGPGKY
jgi:hypothetical protein